MSTVLGVPELLARFARAAAIGEAAANAATDDLATQVASDAASRAPVDTGTLRDSIIHDGGRVYTDVEYAPFVEYGTSDMPAQPFMRPAADTVDGEHATEVAAALMRQA